MLEELQNRSKPRSVPPNTDLEKLKATMMEETLKKFSDKEITKEDLFDSVPGLDELKKSTEREQSLPPQRVGPIDRTLLMGTLEATSKMHRDATAEDVIPVTVDVPRIFSSANLRT